MAKSKAKNNGINVTFDCGAASGVTGSMFLVSTPTKKILLECGMVQTSGDTEKDFSTNSKSFPFNVKEVNYVILCHNHIDHTGRLPKLVRDGFGGKIICNHITAELMRPMLKNSAGIIEQDAEFLSKRRKKKVYPFYTKADVADTLNLMYEYESGEIYKLDDEISFRFLKNSHIIGAVQLELFIKTETGSVKKILYTSDLGALNTVNHYVDELEKCTKAHIVLSECTYGASTKDMKPNRSKDIEKMKTVIKHTCIDNHARVLIPVFSLARAQEMLTVLYETYCNDPSFTVPIYVDSPLICEVNNIYSKVLVGENKELFDKVCAWSNVRFIKEHPDSMKNIESCKYGIIVSSSGFLTKGRSVQYLKKMIGHSRDYVLFCGYSPDDSVAGKIKSGQQYISIDGKKYVCRCNIASLNSFSSHASQLDLRKYLSSIQAEKIYLVHADEESKVEFKKILEDDILKQNRTTRVICANKETVCHL